MLHPMMDVERYLQIDGAQHNAHDRAGIGAYRVSWHSHAAQNGDYRGSPPLHLAHR